MRDVDLQEWIAVRWWKTYKHYTTNRGTTEQRNTDEEDTKRGTTRNAITAKKLTTINERKRKEEEVEKTGNVSSKETG